MQGVEARSRRESRGLHALDLAKVKLRRQKRWEIVALMCIICFGSLSGVVKLLRLLFMDTGERGRNNLWPSLVN